MGKPLIGEVVVLPFPHTDLTVGKRRPALVVASLSDNDVILCQITSQLKSDGFSVIISASDFQKGRLSVDSYARISRLFTVKDSVIIYSAGVLKQNKTDEILKGIRSLF